jgi:hypothetical protein
LAVRYRNRYRLPDADQKKHREAALQKRGREKEMTGWQISRDKVMTFGRQKCTKKRQKGRQMRTNKNERMVDKK